MKYKITLENQVYEVEIADIKARPIVVQVDGEVFEVWPGDAEQTAAEIAATSTESAPGPAAPAPKAATAKTPETSPNGRAVMAPLPGVIEKIEVTTGQAVEKGQPLVVLEAMKMKNVIRSTRSGTVESITATVGQQVQHNDILLTFTD